jgi:glutathione-specific gamma-glutamylcyclotransferase
MAEYLFQTVTMLERLGIHDRNLRSLQEKVAARIDAAHPVGYRRAVPFDSGKY